ncbi:FHA domain-containing protein [Bifidobacterium catulorum]|uniref:FHA domain-containing protein n=1 Tax=Bifidobacterium catulorum TaxID=1630173 RepID=A0A2U2MQW7_9BIFI|nr:FHA domain-containing protein [Bifidobacterium catulorum]PWG59265.1 hypothetical protein DF200_08495 [Bifidobacterium catulorum]
MKIKVRKDRGTGVQTLTVRLARGEAIDDGMVQWLHADALPFLTPFRHEQGMMGTTIRYDVTGCVPLETFLKARLDAGQYAALLFALADLIDVCVARRVPVECVLWNADYIYVDCERGIPRFVILPVTGLKPDKDGPTAPLATLSDRRLIHMSQMDMPKLQAVVDYAAKHPSFSQVEYRPFLEATFGRRDAAVVDGNVDNADVADVEGSEDPDGTRLSTLPHTGDTLDSDDADGGTVLSTLPHAGRADGSDDGGTVLSTLPHAGGTMDSDDAEDGETLLSQTGRHDDGTDVDDGVVDNEGVVAGVADDSGELDTGDYTTGDYANQPEYLTVLQQRSQTVGVVDDTTGDVNADADVDVDDDEDGATVLGSRYVEPARTPIVDDVDNNGDSGPAPVATESKAETKTDGPEPDGIIAEPTAAPVSPRPQSPTVPTTSGNPESPEHPESPENPGQSVDETAEGYSLLDGYVMPANPFEYLDRESKPAEIKPAEIKPAGTMPTGASEPATADESSTAGEATAATAPASAGNVAESPSNGRPESDSRTASASPESEPRPARHAAPMQRPTIPERPIMPDIAAPEATSPARPTVSARPAAPDLPAEPSRRHAAPMRTMSPQPEIQPWSTDGIDNNDGIDDIEDDDSPTTLFGASAANQPKAVFTVRRLRDGRTLSSMQSRATIGRSKSADLHMGGNSNVSRVHAIIEALPDGRFAITDNGSANGTGVGGRPLARNGTEYTTSGGDFTLADDTFIVTRV